MNFRLPTRRKNNKKNLGFTLIELLVVVLIMGILLAVALPLYLSSVRSAGDATVKSNIRSIANAEQAYQVKKHAFTSDWTNMEGDLGTVVSATVGPFDNQPEGVTYQISTAGGDTVAGVTTVAGDLTITATEGAAVDVFGNSSPGETIKYVQKVGEAAGVFGPAVAP